jgi:hypothetical protein
VGIALVDSVDDDPRAGSAILASDMTRPWLLLAIRARGDEQQTLKRTRSIDIVRFSAP